MHIKNKLRFFIMCGLSFLIVVLLLIILISSVLTVINNNKVAKETAAALANMPSASQDGNSGESNITSNRTDTDEKVTTETDSTNVSSSSSSGILILVNKSHGLEKTYVPSDLVDVDLRGVRDTELRSEAATALEKLFEKADAQGITLYCCSGYRSYDTQKELYQENVSLYGQKDADLVSAKPGQSEHQTGLAMDVTAESVNLDLLESFGDTAEGQYIKNNAHKYGFIIRYPSNKTAITGYSYEPWHLRYVGIESATTIFNKGITFEEFLNGN